MMSNLEFTISARDGSARAGEIRTAHGNIRTPAFMPVGTQGTVKGLYPDQLREAGADILLGNTYHLMLRPGAERVERLGGLHKFMNWHNPILTDSGGFQVMSLAKLRKVDPDGVTFQSHIDGSRHRLTPERSIEIQRMLGSDIVMQFDECIALPAEYKDIEKAMRLSLDWAERCKSEFNDGAGQALFGIVQGGDQAELRRQSAECLANIGFDGYAVGGLAVGEPQSVMMRVLEETVPALPEDSPRYLMGVGTPDDIVKAISRGIDMFDCVMPTRAGRHGQAFTSQGRINLRNAKHADDPGPLDAESACPAARDYSRAYLHHLFKSGELLGPMLLSWANISFYQQLMSDARAAIHRGEFQHHIKSVARKFAKMQP